MRDQLIAGAASSRPGNVDRRYGLVEAVLLADKSSDYPELDRVDNEHPGGLRDKARPMPQDVSAGSGPLGPSGRF
jgi:hypothetical protein